jgi:hypothetical protein
MKFKVTMKDPDTLGEAIREAVELDVRVIEDKDEAAAVAEIRCGKLSELCKQWFEFGEYLTVEIDTEAKTCTVVPRSAT